MESSLFNKVLSKLESLGVNIKRFWVSEQSFRIAGLRSHLKDERKYDREFLGAELSEFLKNSGVQQHQRFIMESLGLPNRMTVNPMVEKMVMEAQELLQSQQQSV